MNTELILFLNYFEVDPKVEGNLPVKPAYLQKVANAFSVKLTKCYNTVQKNNFIPKNH